MAGAPISDPSEVRVLLGHLRRVRHAVVDATDGLDTDQLRAPGVGSGTTLLGLIHHLTGVERHWLGRVFLGEAIEIDRTRAKISATRSGSSSCTSSRRPPATPGTPTS